jgi:cell division protein FtsL
VSLPARKLAVPLVAPTLRRVAPAPHPAAHPRTGVTPVARSRRTPTPLFWALAVLVLTAVVVGIVSVSALLVRSSFRVDALERDIADLKVQQQDLISERAELSSPATIHAWARARGMAMPDEVVTLPIGGAGNAERGGDGGSVDG